MAIRQFLITESPATDANQMATILFISRLYWSPVARTGPSPERGEPSYSSTDTASRDSHTQDHRVMTTGELKAESWPGGVSGSDTAAVRQNLDLLIHNGTVSPAATQKNTKA